MVLYFLGRLNAIDISVHLFFSNDWRAEDHCRKSTPFHQKPLHHANYNDQACFDEIYDSQVTRLAKLASFIAGQGCAHASKLTSFLFARIKLHKSQLGQSKAQCISCAEMSQASFEASAVRRNEECVVV